MTIKDKDKNQIEIALEYGVDVLGRRIFLHGDVDEEIVGYAIRGLYLLADISEDPVELFICSYGGELDDAFALHDVTRTVRCPVHTIALGKCMSAAPILVACGAKGGRWASENTTFMLHDIALSVIEDNPANIAVYAELGKDYSRRYAKLMASYTEKNARHWTTLTSGKTDRYFGSEKALEWGVIDGIWSEK